MNDRDPTYRAPDDDAERRIEMARNVSRLIQFAEKQIDAEYAVSVSDTRTERGMRFNGDMQVVAGSLLRVPLAHMVVRSGLAWQERYEINPKRDATPGPGEYDSAFREAGSTSLIMLLTDMIARSGTTAFNILAKEMGGSVGLNRYCIDMGWLDTIVRPIADGSRSISAMTSADDVLRQVESLQALFADATPDQINQSIIAGTIDGMLRNVGEADDHGRAVRTAGADAFYRLSAQIDQDQVAFRHQIGSIHTQDGPLTYVILSSCDARYLNKIDSINNAIEVEMAYACDIQMGKTAIHKEIIAKSSD